MPEPIFGLIQNLRAGAVFEPHARLSFSQEGEDLMIARLFDGQDVGFYVDVGAHHPTRFSNTALLYRQGWWGINIDATPGSMREFRRRRPRDINLEIAISREKRTVRLHRFNEPALNTLSVSLSAERDALDGYSLVSTIDVPAMPLHEVLESNLPAGIEAIDFMTIDAEGHDFDVIRSNDWERYRPRVLLVEVLSSEIEDLSGRPEGKYLRERGYSVHSKFHNSVVFIDRLQNRSAGMPVVPESSHDPKGHVRCS